MNSVSSPLPALTVELTKEPTLEMESAPAKALKSIQQFEYWCWSEPNRMVSLPAPPKPWRFGWWQQDAQRVITSDGASGVGTKNGGVEDGCSSKNQLVGYHGYLQSKTWVMLCRTRLRNQVSTLTAVNGAVVDLSTQVESCRYRHCHEAREAEICHDVDRISTVEGGVVEEATTAVDSGALERRWSSPSCRCPGCRTRRIGDGTNNGDVVGALTTNNLGTNRCSTNINGVVTTIAVNVAPPLMVPLM